MEIFNPLDEPDDPYGLNNHGFDQALVLGSIPFIGVGVVAGAYNSYRENRKRNQYNMANTAYNSFVVTFTLQILYFVLFFTAVMVA